LQLVLIRSNIHLFFVELRWRLLTTPFCHPIEYLLLRLLIDLQLSPLPLSVRSIIGARKYWKFDEGLGDWQLASREVQVIILEVLCRNH